MILCTTRGPIEAQSSNRSTRSAAGIPSEGLRGARRGSLHRSRDGFTLIEILIATAILTIGLIGVLALFPVAIKAGRQVIEDSNAVVIAQSVAEALRAGARNRRGYTSAGHPYFIFSHDGVQDSIPPTAEAVKSSADYYILLPIHRAGAAFSGSSPKTRRKAALERATTFVYPESDSRANGGGDPFRADNDGDDSRYRVDTDADGEDDTLVQDILVEDVYRLGHHLVPGVTPRRRGDTLEYPSGVIDDPRTLDDMMIDTLSQYSYAFKIRPSYFDADLSASAAFQPANKLYHVTVMVFRNFQRPVDRDARSPHLDSTMMVYSLDFEVSI